MSRTLVTAKQLAAHLTAEIRKVEDCEKVTIHGVARLRFPDESGCNWSDSIHVRTAGVPAEYFGPHFQKILARARKQFNLVDE